MEYRIIDQDEAPLQIQEWLEKNKKEENQTVIQTENKTYIVITRGKMRSGGYGIELEAVEEQDNIIHIRVKYIEPESDQFVIQMITYPYLILELNTVDREIILEIQK